MAKTEAVDAPEHPVDLTEELPLDDENVLAAEPPSVWRRYRWPIVGAVVVLVAGAVGLTLWLTSSSAAGHGGDRDDGDREGHNRDHPADGGELGDARAGQPGQSELRRLGAPRTGVNVKAGQTVTAGQVLATVDTSALSEEVTAAQAQLTSAQDRLSSDEASGGLHQFDRLGRGIGHVGGVVVVHRPDQPQGRGP